MTHISSLKDRVEASPALLPVELAKHLADIQEKGLDGVIPPDLTELPAGVRRILDHLFGEEGALMEGSLQMVPRNERLRTPIQPGRSENYAFVPLVDTGLRITQEDHDPKVIEVKAGTLIGPRAALKMAPTARVQLVNPSDPHAKFILANGAGDSEEDQLRSLLGNGWVMAALRGNLFRANEVLASRAHSTATNLGLTLPAEIRGTQTTLPRGGSTLLDPGDFLVSHQAGTAGIRENGGDLTRFWVKEGDLIGEGSAFGFEPLGPLTTEANLQVTAFTCEGLDLSQKKKLATQVSRSLAEKYRIAEERGERKQSDLFDRFAFPYKMVGIQPSVLIVLREGAKVRLAVTTA